jgi:hypothetical protein
VAILTPTGRIGRLQNIGGVPIGLNLDHPVIRNGSPAFLWIAYPPYFDLRNRAIIGTATAGVSLVQTPFGYGAHFAAITDNMIYNEIPIVTASGDGTGAFALVSFANPTVQDGSDANRLITQTAAASLGATAGINISLLANSDLTGSASPGTISINAYDGVNNPGALSATTGVLDGNYHLWAGNMAPALQQITRDGIDISFSGTNIAYTDIRALGQANLLVSGNNADAAGFNGGCLCTQLLAAGFNRNLSLSELRIWAADPFGIFIWKEDYSSPYGLAFRGGAAMPTGFDLIF